LTILPAVGFVGLMGAGAFNPDGGWLLHSYALYEVFGAPGEIALILTPVVIVACLGHTGIVKARRSHRQRRSCGSS
jgi:hypothetical protein